MRWSVETVVTESEVQTLSTKVVVLVVTFRECGREVRCGKKTQERARK